MTADGGWLLETRGLTKRFGGLVAVSDLPLAVPGGAIRGLIGPNGSGKTTAVNLLSGLQSADGGEIRLRGERIDRLRPHEVTARRIGTTNANSAGAAGVRPGPGSPVNPAADPQRPLRGGEGEGRHRDRPLPCAAVGWWSRGGQRGAAPAVGGSVEGGTEGRAT